VRLSGAGGAAPSQPSPRRGGVRRPRAAQPKKKPRAGVPGRACVARTLTTAGTSAVGSSVASDSIHIGGNHENSMTGLKLDRPAPGLKTACPGRGARLGPCPMERTYATDRAPKVSFVSLGCPKALVDSERIITRLRAEGYELARSLAGADLAVVNTCGFLNS